MYGSRKSTIRQVGHFGLGALERARDAITNRPGRPAGVATGAVAAGVPTGVEAGVGQQVPEGMRRFQRALDWAGWLPGVGGVADLIRPNIAHAPEVPAARSPVATRMHLSPIGPERPAAAPPTREALVRALERTRAERPAAVELAAPTPEVRPTPTPTPPPSAPAVIPTPEARAPVITPAVAPTPSPRPPAPVLAGGAPAIGDVRVPEPAALPPTPTLPGEIFRQREPVGQFDAMIRALQALQGGGARVQMPAEGVMPFGPAGAQAEALRRLRERELQRIAGGRYACPRRFPRFRFCFRLVDN